MSIVALKRNSKRFQEPISAKGFSLNGGYRNQRSFGNTNLAALYSANGCNLNDPAVVKLSTKNTKGYIDSVVTYPVCENGNCGGSNGGGANVSGNTIWVKNFSPDDHSQEEYIKNVVQAAAATCTRPLKTDSGKSNPCDAACKSRSYFIGGRRVYTTFNAKNSGKPFTQGALSAGEYLKTGVLRNNCLPTPAAKKPFPPSLLNGGCNVQALTPAQAKANGLLPASWTG